MDLLQGETPKQKYDFLTDLLKTKKENNSGVEVCLLNACHEMDEKGEELFRVIGTDSYVDRCNLHDAKLLIYSLTNKANIDRLKFNEWQKQVTKQISL